MYLFVVALKLRGRDGQVLGRLFTPTLGPSMFRFK